MIFPECTKSNGKGVLKIPEDVIKMILDAQKDGFGIHSTAFNYTFEFKSPYNTTDVWGVLHTL